MEQIRWGIIGCGDVTEVKSGPAFNKVAHSTLVAVMRRDEAKAKDYAQRHRVPKWYGNADDLIHDTEVNAIYIATPPAYHERYTLQAMQAGKPVYVEKPMALDAVEAARMAEAAEQTGVKLSVAHYRRAQPLFLKIRELLREGAIGEVRTVHLELLQPPRSTMIAPSQTNWRVDPALSGGGLFHDLAPHQLDLMLYFFGPPEKAYGFAANRAGLNEADDTVAGTIKFQSGLLVNGLWCFSASPQASTESCTIIGSEGSLRFPVFGQTLTMLRNGGEEVIPFDPLPHVQQPMIEQVVNYFRGTGENPCSAADGVVVMRMMDALTGKGG